MTDQPTGAAPSGPDDDDNVIDIRQFLHAQSLDDIEKAMQLAAQDTESGHPGASVGTLKEPVSEDAAPVMGFIEPQVEDDEDLGWWQRELRGVLPEAFANREAAALTLRQARAVAWNQTQFHGLRSPIYAVRAGGVVVYGGHVMARDVLHFLLAREYTRPIKDAKRTANDSAVEILRASRQDVVRARFRSKRVIAGLSTGSLYVGSLLATAALDDWIVAGPMATLVAAAFGLVGYRARREQHAENGERFTLVSQQDQQDAPLTDDRLVDALRAVGILKSDQTVRPVGFIGREKTGEVTAEIATVDLPQGIPAKRCAAKLDEIAAALGVDQIQLDIQQAGPANRVSFWLADRDPFADSRPSPLMSQRTPLDAWRDGIPVSFTKRGKAIRIKVKDSSYLIGGMTRAGKGIAIMSLVLGALFDMNVKVRFFDGKESGEYNGIAPMLNTFVKGDPLRLLAFLRVMVAEMKRRAHVLGKMGKAKLSPELLAAVGGLELVIVDELAGYTDIEAIRMWLLAAGDEETKPEAIRDAIIGALNVIAAQAASLGIILVLSTQMPEVAVVPSRLRSNVTSKWAMRTESGTHSNNILGGGMSTVANAADIPLSQRGRGILMTPEIGLVENRSFFIDDEAGEVDLIAQVVYDLRKAAKALPHDVADGVEDALFEATGMSSVAGGIGEAVGIIEAGKAAGVRGLLALLLEAFENAGDPEKMTSGELVQALAQLDPATWSGVAGGSPGAIGTALAKAISEQLQADADLERRKPRELTSKEWTKGGRGRGYYLADVRAAAGLAP